MSAAFTPGPWWIDDENGVGAGNEVIAVVKPPINSITRTVVEEVWNANATLIVTAPELLEALQTAVDHIANLHSVLDDLASLGATVAICGSTYDDAKARAAIARATGEQQ